MPFGVTATGFWSKDLQTIDDEVDSGLRSILGESAGTDSDGKIPLSSMAGQLKSLIVDREAALWDLMQAVHASFDPNKATGRMLDAVCSITGTIRNEESNSVATGTCVGTPNTTLDTGRVATVGTTNSRFATATGVAIATGVAYTPSGTYAFNDLRYVPGQNRHYVALGGGVGNGSGPSGTAESITAGGVAWKFIGEGVGIVHTPFFAEVIGPIGAATGTLSTIATPVSGWNAVTNLTSAVAGRNEEKDASLRARREEELAAIGNTTPDAIRANVLRVNQGSTDPSHQPPTSCKVFYNDTDVTDGNGLPPHSVEVLVQDGTVADIAQAIWDSVGAGTRTYGSRTDPVEDSEGNTQFVNWTRPTEVNIWVTAVGRYDASQWPSGSETLVAQAMTSALLTYTADWPISRDVRISPLMAAILRGPQGTTGGMAIVPADGDAPSVPGLLEVESLNIGTATGVVGANQISITARQIAVFATGRCDITATTEEP